ncbi:hypothetical protein T439DRAFT_332025 [Meredithblackwellia eburnea MCA 4105]
MHLATLLPIFLALSTSAQAQSVAWYKPSTNATFLYTINDDGAISATAKSSSGLQVNKAQIWDVDLFTTTKAQITSYKSRGKKIVCYFSAGSYEEDRPDSATFNQACYCNKGRTCKMSGWDEWWVDIHSSACKTNIHSVMEARIKLAKSKGCDIVDPDNVDSYTNENGHGNTESDQLAYNLWLAETAHANGLGAALKNGGDLVQAYTTQVVGAFDLVLVEQCEEYSECSTYSPFTKAGKLAVDIEYSKEPKLKAGWFSLRYNSLGLSYKNVVKTNPAF